MVTTKAMYLASAEGASSTGSTPTSGSTSNAVDQIW
jgi:hypothetical protein